MQSTHRAFWTAVLAVGLLAGCGPGGEPSEPPSASASAPPSPSVASSEAGNPVDAMYDVGGHDLFMRCVGSGSPTVVYLHGWINDAGVLPHRNGNHIARELVDDHRVCLYDRRNVGRSETVDAVQTHEDMLGDMEKVLDAGGVEPPYILMGASFGGLLAYSYLNHHPDDVAGMVLIDAMFPDELALDRYVPRGQRFVDYAKEDACCTLERNAQYPMVRDLQAYLGKEPDVPVIYLASQREPRDRNDYGSPEYDAKVTPALEDYVGRYSPGELRWLDAPHFMEPVVPDEIADAVRDVAALASAP